MRFRPILLVSALAILMAAPLSAHSQSKDQHQNDPPHKVDPPPPPPPPRQEPEQRPTPPPPPTPAPQPQKPSAPPPEQPKPAPEQHQAPPPTPSAPSPAPQKPSAPPSDPPKPAAPTPQPQKPSSPPPVPEKPAPPQQPEQPKPAPPTPTSPIKGQGSDDPLKRPTPKPQDPTKPTATPPKNSGGDNPLGRPKPQPPVTANPPSQQKPLPPAPGGRQSLPSSSSQPGPIASGEPSHIIVHKPVPPHFDKPPILHHPGGGCRWGYYAYYPNWLDQFFCYTFYYYIYDQDTCVPSPWYYYPDMPGYVNAQRTWPDSDFVTDSDFVAFTWQSPQNDEPGTEAFYLDSAIDELVKLFSNKDQAKVNDLVPSGYKVNVDLDGSGSYDIASEDFQQLLLDNVNTTQTKRYSILSVQKGHDQARVQAMHTFLEPDGTSTTLLQTLLLARTPDGYRVASIRVSQPPKF